MKEFVPRMERRTFLKAIGRTVTGGIIVGLYACGTTTAPADGVDCDVTPDDPSCAGGGVQRLAQT